MIVEATQENLNRAVSDVARVATSSRGSLPILNNILLTTEGGRLKLSATNLEIAITETLGAKVQTEGSITIPARLFQEYIGSLPSGGKVTLELQDHKLQVACGDYRSTINGVLADDFPVIPHIDGDPLWKISALQLKKALSQVVFAASGDDARPVLTGVLLHALDGHVYLAATDSYRLSERRTGKSATDISLLIPASALSDLARILTDEDKEVFIYGDDQQVAFRVDQVELVSRLIEGSYPDYRKLLPNDFEITAELEKAEFQGATKLAALFAKENAGSILLKISEASQTLSVQSSASQLGENTTALTAKVKGEGEVSLNARFLLDGLQSLGGSQVIFSMNGKLNPCLLRSAESPDYRHVIMPLKS